MPVRHFRILGVRSSRLYARGTAPPGGWRATLLTDLACDPGGHLWAHHRTPRGVDLLELTYRPSSPGDPRPLPSAPWQPLAARATPTAAERAAPPPPPPPEAWEWDT